MIMKKTALFFLSICICWSYNLTADLKADFIVSDLIIQPSGFIHLKLKNQSSINITITPKLREKTFIIVYINGIKRAEYSFKYVDIKLFKPKGTASFPTNFRKQKDLKIKIVINPLKLISESNFSNNTLIKQY